MKTAGQAVHGWKQIGAVLAILSGILLAAAAGAAPLPQKVGDLDADGVPTVLDLVRLINYLNGDTSVLPPVPGATTGEREAFLDISGDGVVDQRDIDALGDAILEITALPEFPATRITGASPANGEEMVSPDRTVILRFSRRIQPATITSNSVYLIANGARLAGRLEVSSTGTFATFFPASPFPASTEIRIVVDGNLIRDIYGLPVNARSADSLSAALADGPSALRGQFDFRTLPLFRITGTHVWGYVFDSYNTNAGGGLSVRSPRDTNSSPLAHPMGEGPGVRAAAPGDPVFPLTYYRPVVGATIRVDAFPQANAVTDARGYFILTNMPAPEFFVHVDGTTATNSTLNPQLSTNFVYPSVGKPFHSIPGQSVQLLMGANPFHVYLPPMSLGDVAPLDTNVLTDVFFGRDALAQLERMFPTNDPAMFRKVCVRFPPGSARDNLGRLATMGTIVPVPPDRIPAPLPPNLNPRLVISVQAMLPDGAAATRFDVPAPVIFPNLDGLAPGEKALFFSFNHAAGRWDIIGAGTATTNGTIETDPGVGIRAPGWHLVQVGTGATAGEACKPGEVCARFEGELGDLIKINLGGTVALSDIQPPDPRINFVVVSAISGGILFDEDGEPIFGTTPRFRASGVAYYRPWIFEPSKSSERLNGKLKYPAKGATGPLTGRFQASLWSGNQEKRDNDTIGIIRIDVGEEYSTKGDNAVKSGTSKLNVMSQRQRLRYLGFPDRAGNLVEATSSATDPDGQWATGLFNAAAISGAHLPNPSFIHSRINSANAPRWTLGTPAAGWAFSTQPPDCDERWGTDWAFRLINEGGSRYQTATGSRLTITAVSKRQGGVTCHPAGHTAGMDVDVDTPSSRDLSRPFYRVHAANSKKYLAAGVFSDGNGDGMPDDPTGENHIITYDAGSVGIATKSLDPTAPAREHWLEHTTDTYNSQTILGAIRSLIVDPVSPAYYSIDEVRARITAFLEAAQAVGVPIQNMLYNDPRTWDGTVIYFAGHNNHIHVNVDLPSSAASPSPFAPAAPTPISAAPGFGSDTRLYYRFQLANGFELAGRSSMAGTFTEILSPNIDYTLILYRPADNRWAVYRGRSNASGQVTDLGTLILDQFGGPDTDGDGIPDTGEYALGTRPDERDSDGDGVSDDAELTQGLNPNSGRAFPTGVIASLPLRGEAKEVVVEENLAYVATGSYGLAIVDVSRFDNPIILGQLDLPGDGTDVGVDTTLKRAVVATGTSGLQVVDVSDPMLPRVTRNIPLVSTRVEVLLGMIFAATANSIVSIDLRTGQTFQTLNLGGSALTDLTSEGTYLYTMDSGGRLRAVEFANLSMSARGLLTVPEGGGRLFVGGGIAYTVALGVPSNGGGFATVNVSNSTNLTLISGSDRTEPRSRGGIAANGSGLALQVGEIFPGAANPDFRQPKLEVWDVSDPGNTDNDVKFYAMPLGPQSVVIASGVAFVTCGTNGLLVVNYRAFDSIRVSPSISLGTSFLFNPPRTEEGKSARLTALTADDSQVRDVEFYIDGAQIRRDVSFPFEYYFVTPARMQATNTFRVRAKATDTGGNFTWSDEVVVELVDDATPPQVTRFFPPSGTIVASNRVVAAFFSEPMETRLLGPETFELISAGRDGRIGSVDDMRVSGGTLEYVEGNNAAYLHFTNDLPSGAYQVSVAPPLSDRAGIALSRVFTNTFAVPAPLCAVRPTDCLDTDGDGVPDSLEAALGLSHLSTDSNGNGIPDGAEDFDQDGVSNAAEILLGSDPRKADSDRDGLPDFEELFVYNSDPNNPDMDGDGWPDGFETVAGADPRNPTSRPVQRFTVTATRVGFYNVYAPDPPPMMRISVSAATVFWNVPERLAVTNQFLTTPIVSYENR